MKKELMLIEVDADQAEALKLHLTEKGADVYVQTDEKSIYKADEYRSELEKVTVRNLLQKNLREISVLFEGVNYETADIAEPLYEKVKKGIVFGRYKEDLFANFADEYLERYVLYFKDHTTMRLREYMGYDDMSLVFEPEHFDEEEEPEICTVEQPKKIMEISI